LGYPIPPVLDGPIQGWLVGQIRADADKAAQEQEAKKEERETMSPTGRRRRDGGAPILQSIQPLFS